MSASVPSRSSTARFVADIIQYADGERPEEWRQFRGFSTPKIDLPPRVVTPPQITREMIERSGTLDQARTLAADIALFSEKMADENGQPLQGERILVTYPRRGDEPVYLRLVHLEPGSPTEAFPYEVEVARSLLLRPPNSAIANAPPLLVRLEQLAASIGGRIPPPAGAVGRQPGPSAGGPNGAIGGGPSVQGGPGGGISPQFTGYLDDLLFAIQPIIVVAQMPPMMPLCAPFPSVEVTSGGRVSTAGILVRDSAGRRGFTAAYHATGPVGTEVRLGAFDSVVSAASERHDTVFVPLPDGVNIPELRGLHGIMVGRPPWDNEPVRFWGSTTGDQETCVTSHDKGLPDVVPGRQRCVQTEPDTNEGDSGAALVNQDDQVVGFAFQRTAWGKKPQFTDWVWARGALEALGLQADISVAGAK